MRAAHDGNDPEKVIFNYSSRVLTPNEKTLLVKGLNLSIPPKKLNYGDTLSPFELLYRDVLKSEPTFLNGMKAPLEAALRNTAFDCLNNFDPKLEQNLPPTEVEALKSLMKDSLIVIQKSDNSVIILDRTAYVQRVKELLLMDASKFRKLECVCENLDVDLE